MTISTAFESPHFWIIVLFKCVTPYTGKRKTKSNWCCCCWVTSVVSNSVRPHRRQPTRLPRPWGSPGKNTGVGCHFLLQCMKVKSEKWKWSRSVIYDPQRPHGLAAHQAPPSMGLSRQEYWSGVPLPSPKVKLGVYKSLHWNIIMCSQPVCIYTTVSLSVLPDNHWGGTQNTV